MDHLRRFDRSWMDELHLRDGTAVWWRPVVPSDRDAFEASFPHLSARTRYLRFHNRVRQLPPSLWRKLVDEVDQRRHIAFALHAGAEVIAVCHLVRSEQDWHTADLSLLVTDEWQGRGAGSLLAREVLAVAGDVHRIDTAVLLENDAALRTLRGLGETLVEYVDGDYRARVDLRRPDVA